jgi:hypothetical protein
MSSGLTGAGAWQLPRSSRVHASRMTTRTPSSSSRNRGSDEQLSASARIGPVYVRQYGCRPQVAPATPGSVRGRWRRGSSPATPAIVTDARRVLRQSCATAGPWHRFVAQKPMTAGSGLVTTPRCASARHRAIPTLLRDCGPSRPHLARRGPTDFAMRMRGLEPPRPYGHTDLNRARLPIPPHPRGRTILAPGRLTPR